MALSIQDQGAERGWLLPTQRDLGSVDSDLAEVRFIRALLRPRGQGHHGAGERTGDFTILL